MTTPISYPTPAKTLRPLAALCLAGLLLAPAAGAVCGDVSGDAQITTSDAQRVLKAAVGQQVELTCTDDCAALEGRLEVLEALLANLTMDGDNLVLTGMNFQVVSGSGDTDGDINGTGNIIIGYNEADDQSDDKTGSHNLIVGMNHSYSNYGGIVAGQDNEITGEVSSVLGGTENSADGDGAVVVGGQDNEADGETSVVVAGESNRTTGRSCAISSGLQNLCTGLAATIDGGSLNLCSATASVIGGGSSRTLGGPSPNGWLAASLGPLY